MLRLKDFELKRIKVFKYLSSLKDLSNYEFTLVNEYERSELYTTLLTSIKVNYVPFGHFVLTSLCLVRITNIHENLKHKQN